MRLFFVSALLILFSGCSSLPKVTGANLLPSVKTFSIDKNITIPEDPFVQTPGMLWSSAIGGVAIGAGSVVGGAVAGGTSASFLSKEKQFSAFLKDKNIDIKKIVYNSFARQFQEQVNDISFSELQPDILVTLEIIFYGIHPSSPLKKTLEPMLGISAVVTHSSGKVVWAEEEKLLFPNEQEVTPYYFEQYVENPDLISEGFTQLSNNISKKLIADLKKQRDT